MCAWVHACARMSVFVCMSVCVTVHDVFVHGPRFFELWCCAWHHACSLFGNNCVLAIRCILRSGRFSGRSCRYLQVCSGKLQTISFLALEDRPPLRPPPPPRPTPSKQKQHRKCRCCFGRRPKQKDRCRRQYFGHILNLKIQTACAELDELNPPSLPCTGRKLGSASKHVEAKTTCSRPHIDSTHYERRLAQATTPPSA